MGTPSGPIAIASIATQEDADAFREISEEWVTQYFSLEDTERALLADPVGRIVERGGDVLIARDPDGGAALGCVALIAYPGGVVELAKMGVRRAAQGRGIGRQLLTAAIQRARDLGGSRLFLGTSSRLASALYLYEQAGFVRTERSQLPVATDYYPRADILMELM
ncbi:GNAT family N-acetyltransferase [Rhodococcus sp. ACT016]|uniref:GNAT family N-acetyltransferase n=1 Tax=Rhodococcus sp. ACT016 TaxID=3134808 RepID=UPI003D2AEA69